MSGSDPQVADLVALDWYEHPIDAACHQQEDCSVLWARKAGARWVEVHPRSHKTRKSYRVAVTRGRKPTMRRS